MVKAILEGRKTQTRRPIKDTGLYAIDSKHHLNTEKEKKALINTKSPYKIGDILYVRETWQDLINNTGDGLDNYYRADYDEEHQENLKPWKPSIHMPKEAARLFLKVIGVRVEIVNEISESDAVAEGIYGLSSKLNIPFNGQANTPKRVFKYLWDSIYNEKYPWSKKPFVFITDFEIHEVKK
jgi:hypothetical protein